MRTVFKRESAMVNWKPYLEVMIESGFMLPDGKPLLHLVLELGLGLQPPNYSVWHFGHFNPATERFNSYLTTLQETGIVQYLDKLAR